MFADGRAESPHKKKKKKSFAAPQKYFEAPLTYFMSLIFFHNPSKPELFLCFQWI